VLLISVAIVAPVLFTQRSFGTDWLLHLRLVFDQQRAIQANGFPSLFAHFDPGGAFNPVFAYLGGTLYAICGYLAVLLGGRSSTAYALMHVVLVFTALSGWLWLSRQFGLRGWLAHAPGLTYVTGAWYLGDLIGRGGFSSTAATSMIPLAVASGVWLVRAPAWKPGPVLAFLAAVVVATGSHNISLLWSVIFLGALGIALLAFIRPRRASFPVRRLLGLALLAVLAAAVNAWFLFPDLAYSNRAIISGKVQFFDWGAWFARPSNWLNPLRSLPPEHREYFRILSRDTGLQTAPNSLYTQLPVLTILWLAASAGRLLAKHRSSRIVRAWLAQVCVLAALIFLTADQGIWHSFPKLLRFTQFSMRLNTFVLLALSGLVLTTLVWLQQADSRRRRRGLLGVLAVCLVFNFGLAIWQGWNTNSTAVSVGTGAPRSIVFADPTSAPYWYASNDFWDESEPIVQNSATYPGKNLILVDLHKVHGDHYQTTIPASAAAGLTAVNIGGGPYLVDIKGLEDIGRNNWGLRVVSVPVGTSSPTVKVRVTPSATAPVVLGRIVTLLALLACIVVVTVTARRARRAAPGSSVPRGSSRPGRRPPGGIWRLIGRRGPRREPRKAESNG
jgi:hypothetical protein